MMNASTIIKDKHYYSGIAMIAILLCHFNTVSVSWHEWLKLLTPGFIGVDFFVFFSGWSLCYSWERNGIATFYQRRLKRILPLYVIFAGVVTVLFIILRRDHFSLFDWFCNLSTLNYWGAGGAYIDWYLPALFAFYALFPLVYFIVKKTRLVGVCAFLILCGLLLFFLDFNWRYIAALARIPIFSLGILFFIDKSEKKNIGIWGCIIYLITAIVLVFFRAGLDGVFLTNCVAGVIILLISIIMPWIKKYFGKSIEYIGNHSLEIYVGHIISCWIIELIHINQFTVLILYAVLNVAISIIMIRINGILNKYIVK